MGQSLTLKAVGYWRTPETKKWPRPQWLVQPDWQVKEREQIVAYLCSGHTSAAWLGCSYCRFDCGIAEVLLGNRDLTDGEWLWPQGLAHYVLHHDVILPEPFVRTMRGHEWRTPEIEKVPRIDGEDGVRMDFSFWENWAREHRRRPWFVFW